MGRATTGFGVLRSRIVYSFVLDEISMRVQRLETMENITAGYSRTEKETTQERAATMYNVLYSSTCEESSALIYKYHISKVITTPLTEDRTAPCLKDRLSGTRSKAFLPRHVLGMSPNASSLIRLRFI